MVLSFKDRFWREDSILAHGGELLTGLNSQNFSEAGEPPSQVLGGLHGLLQVQWGGQAATGVGPHTRNQVLMDLQKVETKAQISPETEETIQNWSLYPWSLGSRSYLKPGQFQLFTASVQRNKRWIFAGDSQNLAGLGTMNGAIQSALDAVKVYFG